MRAFPVWTLLAINVLTNALGGCAFDTVVSVVIFTYELCPFSIPVPSNPGGALALLVYGEFTVAGPPVDLPRADGNPQVRLTGDSDGNDIRSGDRGWSNREAYQQRGNPKSCVGRVGCFDDRTGPSPAESR